MQLTVDIIIDADIRIGILPGTKNTIKRFISSLIELLKDGGLQIYPMQKDERNVAYTLNSCTLLLFMTSLTINIIE